MRKFILIWFMVVSFPAFPQVWTYNCPGGEEYESPDYKVTVACEHAYHYLSIKSVVNINKIKQYDILGNEVKRVICMVKEFTMQSISLSPGVSIMHVHNTNEYDIKKKIKLG